MELGLDVPKGVIGDVESEQLLLASQPLLLGHRRHALHQAGPGIVELAGLGEHPEERGLPALPLLDDLTGAIGEAIDRRQQLAALSQAVGRTGADQALQDPLVQLARVDAHAHVEHGRERSLGGTLGEEQLDGVRSHVLDHRQAVADLALLDGETGLRSVDVGRQDLDPAGVAVENGRRHLVVVASLVVEESGQVLEIMA